MQLLALDSVLSFFGALFRNKYFWIAVFVLIIYLVIKKNWAALQTWSAPSYVEPTKDAQGHNIAVSAERQKVLRGYANSLYTGLHNWYGLGWLDSGIDLLANVNSCTDTELKYIAQWYLKVLNKIDRVSLREDLDNAIIPTSDLDEKIIARLQQMGEI